jgi:RecB family exonuclease
MQLALSESPATPSARLVTGPLPVLETALAREVEAIKAADALAPIAVLIGGTLLRPYLQRRLATRTGGHAGVAFLTVAELAVRLGEPAMVEQGRKPLPPLATRVLVGEVAREASGYFAPVAHTAGFADALHRLFRELTQAGLDPETFWESVPAAGGNRRKFAELAELYARYGARRRGHYGPDDCLAAADPNRLGAQALCVYGLWNPPAALRAVLELVAERVPVTAFLAESGNAEADGAHFDLRRRLAELGAERTVVEPAAGEAEALGTLPHLQRRLFRTSREPAPDEGNGAGETTLLSSPDPAREVRAAARACLDWAAAGIPFHEMAVAYRQAEEYRPLVDSTFREAGIPVYLDEGTPISERPLGRRARALLDLVGGEMERRAVMDFLTDADLPEATRARYGGVPGARWDADSRRAGVVRGREQWRERLRTLRAREEERHKIEDREEGEPPPAWLPQRLERLTHLERFADDLGQTLAAAPRSAPFSAHLAYLRRLFGTYLRDPKPILDALAPLAALDALARPIDFPHFRDMVAGAIDRLRSEEALGARAGLFGRRGVNVLDVNTLRHMSFRCVVVLGVNERSFPPPPRQDALLLDEERRQMNDRAGTALPLRVLGPDPEPLGFALAVQAAGEHLQLSYSRTESGEGRAQLPSSFFRAAAEALAGETVPAERIDSLARPWMTREPAGRIGAPAPGAALTLDEYDRTLLEARPALGTAALAGEADFTRAIAAHRARWELRRLTPYDGGLDGLDARELLERHPATTGPMSPSSLETYALCPLQLFFGKLLGLRAVEEPEEIETISPMDRGSLVHKVLERFLVECGDSAPPSEARRDAQLGRLEEIALEECDAAEARGETGYPLLWRYERQAIVDDLRRWYDQEVADPEAGRFDHGAFELRFGPARHEPDTSPLSTDEPLRIRAGERELLLQGRIDRVNWNPRTGAYRVIDYKTGSVRDEHRDGALSGGKALQLPVYLLAGAERVGSHPKRGEAQYFFASRYGSFRRVRFTAEHFADRREDLERILASFAAGMRTGNFHARPGRHCDYCDFDPICDARRQALLDRKREDPCVKEMDEIEAIR